MDAYPARRSREKNTSHLDAFILAGGGSVRFGSDKASAEVLGKPLIMHTADALRARYRRVFVVSSPGRSYESFGLETIFDERVDQGPLGGIEAALLHADSQLVAIAPCDVTGLDADWYAALEPHAVGGAAALFDTRWHPLVAVYDRSILPVVQRRLDAGKRAVRELLDEVGVRVPTPLDFAQLTSINRPEDIP